MQISAKNLGELRSPNFCQRCFWVKTHQKQLPYRMFPGIFSSIDSYTKSIVEGYVSREGRLPEWLKDIGAVSKAFRSAKDAMKSKKVSASMKFNTAYKDILLTGIPDAIYQRPNGKIVIVDYKTARYTAGQDELLPIYEIQLNGYAYIPFKSNANGKAKGSFEWKKMYHYFMYNKDDFMAHYHLRSNVETTFFMIKSKFGSFVRSKTETACINEILLKVLCHNICVVIQEMFELGIEPNFLRGTE